MYTNVVSTRRLCGHLATALVALGLAACTGSDGDNLYDGGGNATDGCGEVTGSGPGSGSASAHADASRSESEVEITQENSKFVASRIVTLSNDFGGAAQADVTVDTGNGNVGTCRRDGGYVFKVYAYARGASEQEARDNLDRVSVSHSDTLAAGTLTLDTSATLTAIDDPGLPVPLPGTGTDNVEWGATVLAGLPASADYTFDLGTSNGVVEATGFSGSSATLDSSNGEVALDGRWDEATLDTSNGYVVVDGDFGGLDASTSNGGIVADLDSRRSADVTLDTSNGEIDVHLRASGAAGYDLSGDATNGEVEISVAGTQPVGTQTDESKHYQTPDYDSRAVQISVQADTSNGGVSIRD